MKQNVFNLNVARAHLDRNAFDLSHNDVFSCAPGMLLPISTTEVLPNEHYEINPQIFLRTMPLNSAAFVRMRQHIEFFFVPMRVLCRQFNQFVVGTKYPISAISQLNAFEGNLPKVSFRDLRLAFDKITQSDLLVDGMGSSVRLQAIRLLDLLGYGVTNDSNFASSSLPQSYSISLLRLAAYQKIYSDFYRNPYYEGVDVSSFSLDSYFNKSFGSSVADKNVLRSLCTLRYRNWAKDYFTCVQPQFEGAPFVTRSVDMSSFTFDTGSSNAVFCPSVMDGDLSSYTTGDGSKVSSLFPLGYDGTDVQDLSRMYIPVHNIRAAFALDKLLRLQQQAGNGSYGEQVRNRFGAANVHDDWKATYLGGSSAPISISEVITTANTAASVGDGLTGDIYGKASSVNDGSILFDSREHGIIMGIFSVTPEADYNSTGIDSHNLKLSFEQFFQPEFDRLGKQPLNSFQLSLTKPVDFTGSSWSDKVIGYQNRYLEYKTGIDKVHGEFCTGGSLSAWSAPRNTGLVLSNTQVSSSVSPELNIYSLKVSPKILNSICSVSFDGAKLDTDPIIVDSHIGIKAIRPMSVSGEPLLS